MCMSLPSLSWQVPAHRVILCAASDWWRAVLSNDAEASPRPPVVLTAVAAAESAVARVELDSGIITYNTLLQCLVRARTS